MPTATQWQPTSLSLVGLFVIQSTCFTFPTNNRFHDFYNWFGIFVLDIPKRYAGLSNISIEHILLAVPAVIAPKLWVGPWHYPTPKRGSCFYMKLLCSRLSRISRNSSVLCLRCSASCFAMRSPSFDMCVCSRDQLSSTPSLYTSCAA